MEAPRIETVDTTDRPRSRRRRLPWIVRTSRSWSQLIMSLALLRVLAAVAGVLPSTVLAMAWWGPGNLAVAGAVLASAGLLGSIVFAKRVGPWTRLWLLTLIVSHATVFIVFPTDWLIAQLQTDSTLFNVQTDRAVYALTIDDGLDSDVTPLILETLRRHDAHATFFVLGQSVIDHPELARRCLDAGHELANHQMTDTPAIALEADDLERQIVACHEALSELTEPTWFRPGGGIMTVRARDVCRRLGYRVALASVFPYDCYHASARFNAAYVAGRVRPGEVVVLHDVAERGRRTAQALEKALPQLAERGLSAVTLSDLVKRQ